MIRTGTPFFIPDVIQVIQLLQVVAWISHKGKRPNNMSGVKRLSLKDLPNGRVLTKHNILFLAGV